MYQQFIILFPLTIESLPKMHNLLVQVVFPSRRGLPGWTAGGVHALWVSEDPPQRTHILSIGLQEKPSVPPFQLETH